MSLNTVLKKKNHSLCLEILEGFSFWTNNTLPKWENCIPVEIICMSYSLQILFWTHKWSIALTDVLNTHKHTHTFEHKIVTHTPSPISEGREAICPLKQRHNDQIRGLYEWDFTAVKSSFAASCCQTASTSTLLIILHTHPTKPALFIPCKQWHKHCSTDDLITCGPFKQLLTAVNSGWDLKPFIA